MVNDIHGRDSVFRLLIGDAPRQRPDFVCLNGDLLNSIESEKALFEGFLASASELLTPAGIPLFWPWRRRFRLPGLPLKSGGGYEKAFCLLTLALAGYWVHGSAGLGAF